MSEQWPRLSSSARSLTQLLCWLGALGEAVGQHIRQTLGRGNAEVPLYKVQLRILKKQPLYACFVLLYVRSPCILMKMIYAFYNPTTNTK